MKIVFLGRYQRLVESAGFIKQFPAVHHGPPVYLVLLKHPRQRGDLADKVTCPTGLTKVVSIGNYPITVFGIFAQYLQGIGREKVVLCQHLYPCPGCTHNAIVYILPNGPVRMNKNKLHTAEALKRHAANSAIKKSAVFIVR